MLTALLISLLFGGGGTSAIVITPDMLTGMIKEVRMSVVDPARADAAVELLKGARSDVKSFEKSFAKSGKTLTMLYKQHAGDSQEMLAQLDELNGKWEATQVAVLDARFQLKELLPRDEWEALFSGAQ